MIDDVDLKLCTVYFFEFVEIKVKSIFVDLGIDLVYSLRLQEEPSEILFSKKIHHLLPEKKADVDIGI